MCLARLTQSIHNSFIWLGIIQQKNSCFELEKKGLFPDQTQIKEFIVSQKLPWIRRGKYCMYGIYIKMFHMFKLRISFSSWEIHATVSCFTINLTVMLALFPNSKWLLLLKSLNLICWKCLIPKGIRLIFLPVEIHQSFLQVNNINF